MPLLRHSFVLQLARKPTSGRTTFQGADHRGDTRERPLDIRVIAATLLTEAQARRGHRIRSDLYLHLNVFPILCLPLREWEEDIPLLAAHLLRIACRRLIRKEPILTKGVVRQLQSYDWPGNVRALHKVMKRAAIVSQDRKLVIELPGRAPLATHKSFRTEAQMQAFALDDLIAAPREASGRVSAPPAQPNCWVSGRPPSIRGCGK